MTWYDDGMRTIIELTDKQLEQLKHYCERERISRAEAVRRGVDRIVSEQEEKDRAFRASFGAWKDLNIDALEYVRDLRDEWER
jgi:metal-responsive CopG/Arc/MetJ family transcriptional regulator